MIVARMKVEEHDGRQCLVGKTLINWRHSIGTRLVIRRVGDWYELIELGRREGSRDERAILSFVDPDEDRTCHEGKR